MKDFKITYSQKVFNSDKLKPGFICYSFWDVFYFTIHSRAGNKPLQKFHNQGSRRVTKKIRVSRRVTKIGKR